ncbi:cyclic GMP-AMP synthase isoform X2 [Zonotrichia albicollis]|uniref:cyclic GMP-AMP synthase isoform X2 n=1 Tax=Zonotrichia albicollis TaxID=44394 RepID=UPI003D80DF5F
MAAGPGAPPRLLWPGARGGACGSGGPGASPRPPVPAPRTAEKAGRCQCSRVLAPRAGGRSRPGAGKRSHRIGGRPQLDCCCRSYPVPGLKLARRATSYLRPARRVSFPRGGALLGRGTRPKPEAGTPLLARPRSPCCWCGEGAAAMDAAGGRGARARRGTRSTAPRSRGREKGAARSPSRGRAAGEGSSAIATLRTPRTDGAPARGGRSARRTPGAREPPAGGAAGGAEAPPAPRSRAPAARVPAAPGSHGAVPDGAVAAAGRRPPPAADALRLREVLSRLSLLREDVSEASTLVNTVVRHLVQAIRDRESCFSSMEQQSAGSYYERVKISEPNEFDIMLVIPIKQNANDSTRLQLDESDDTGAYYYASFKRGPIERGWLKFLEEDGKLSASKMMQALRDIIKQEVKNIRGNTWRLSFSHIEKDMIKNHGNSKTCCESNGPKCCRKGCLKLLKFLLEQLKRKYPKELEKFCSYHVKTAFLHSCVMWPNDTDWYLGNLDHSFQQCLGFFVDCLQKSQLTHFFIPQYNLLSQEDKARHHFLSRKISYELNNGFPVFHENY